MNCREDVVCVTDGLEERKNYDGTVMQTVSEKIGEEYKNWHENDVIFISAPTGTGKTTFILHTLVPYAVSQRKKILYLVNRIVLKKQIETELIELGRIFRNKGVCLAKIEDCIEIITYQTLERMIKVASFDWAAFNKVSSYLSCDYLVMDEAHYFMSDAVFNTSTELAFNCIMGCERLGRINVGGQIRIFMSATMENVQNYFEKYHIMIENAYNQNMTGYMPQMFSMNPPYPNLPIAIDIISQSLLDLVGYKRNYNNQVSGGCISQVSNLNQPLYVHFNVCQYKIPQEDRYKNLNVHLIESYDSLSDIICNNKKKWLIFVDSKSRGEQLNKKLEDEGINSVFLHAQYKRDSTTAEAVDTIVESRRCDADVCIMTYVLDNGVSIADNRTHIVIFADNREQFLQCLGRSRLKDYSTAHLYIPIRSADIFSKRKLEIDRIYRFTQFFDSVGLNAPVILPDRQWRLIDAVCKSEDDYEALKKVCYTYHNCTIKSMLSMEQIDYMYRIYKELVLNLKKDQWAFVRQQLRWLDREGDTDSIIKEYYMCLNDKIIELLNLGVRGMKNTNVNDNNPVEMDRRTAYEWYNLIHLKLRNKVKVQAGENIDQYVAGGYTVAKLLNRLTRRASITETTDNQMIKDEMFNVIMEYLKYPYKMTRTGKKSKDSNNDPIDNVRWKIERTD